MWGGVLPKADCEFYGDNMKADVAFMSSEGSVKAACLLFL